jgi:hypothetical protein
MSETPEAVEADPSNENLGPLESVWIPEKLAKHVDPNSPPPARLMGAKAMVPMGPKDMAHVVYQLRFDPEPKIAKIAEQTFVRFDEKILNAVLSDSIAPQVLDAFARSLVRDSGQVQKVLLNKATPDTAFAYVAKHAEDQQIIDMVAGNQERLLRHHDIVRGLSHNPKALRSEIDRAVDFLVREGVFLKDVPEFEDSFMRLGKKEALAALQKIEISADQLSENEKEYAAENGLSPEEVLLGTSADAAKAALLEAAEDDETEAIDLERTPLNQLPIGLQIKMAMMGNHARAIEALGSTNKMVAVAGIRNPQIKEGDIRKIAHKRGMHEDVIREICNNNDWTKAYPVKLALIQNPKTPPMLVMRWLPLMRPNDLKGLARSKQVPGNVSTQAKRILQQKGGR